MSTFAYADQSDSTPSIKEFTPPQFIEADQNQDQRLDTDEQGRIILDRFNARDLNDDGRLSDDELPPDPFTAADQDQDQVVSRKEFMQFRFGFFERYDEDQNEALDHQEYRRWLDAQ